MPDYSFVIQNRFKYLVNLMNSNNEPRKRYIFAKKLVGHSSGVNQLASNFAGTLLASGGCDGTLIWDLTSYKPVSVPQNPSPRGQVTCLRWITGSFDHQDTLCIGTSMGYLVIWQQNFETGSFEEVYARPLFPRDVYDIQFDKTMDHDEFRICLSGRDGIIQTWHVSAASYEEAKPEDTERFSMSNIFSIQCPVEKPRSISFVDDNSDMKVRIIGKSGEMYVFNSSGNTVHHKELGHFVGSSDVNDYKRLLVIDAGTEYKLYSINELNITYMRSYPTATEGAHYPRQVVFGENEKVIVGGSKEGVVHVFDTKSGSPLDVLHHTPKTRVLAVSAYVRSGVHYIAAASSQDDSSVIYIWSFKPPTPIKRKRVRNRGCFRSFTQVFVVLLLIVFLLLGVDHFYMRESSVATKILITLPSFILHGSIAFKIKDLQYRLAVRRLTQTSAGQTVSSPTPPDLLAPTTTSCDHTYTSTYYPIPTCESSLESLSNQLDEWKWYSRQGSWAVRDLRQENTKLRELVEGSLEELKRYIRVGHVLDEPREHDQNHQKDEL